MTNHPIAAAEFKAKCLDILDRVASRELERVTITKRGRIVAILTPPDSQVTEVQALHGFMRGSVTIPPELDLTAPISDQDFIATYGNLHG